MKCLESNDRECVLRKIEELIKAGCYNGKLIGKDIADGVREIVHELWLRSDYELRCELLKTLKSLDIANGWVRDALSMNTKRLKSGWLGAASMGRVGWRGVTSLKTSRTYRGMCSAGTRSRCVRS